MDEDRQRNNEREWEWVVATRAVPISAIIGQREAVPSWPDFHPEDFCHRCGHRNVRSWFAAADDWDKAWAEVEPDIQSVLCPQCFTELWEKATGRRVTWELRQARD